MGGPAASSTYYSRLNDGGFKVGGKKVSVEKIEAPLIKRREFSKDNITFPPKEPLREGGKTRRHE